MPYFITVLDSPFGKQEVVVKAGFPEAAKLLVQVFDARQIGMGRMHGTCSQIVAGPRRTTKKALVGMVRQHRITGEVWAKTL